MDYTEYFYNCSRVYINSIHPTLYEDIVGVISDLPKRAKQAEINKDLFWLLTAKDWLYHSIPPALPSIPPPDLHLLGTTKEGVASSNDSTPCLSTTTLHARWKADFARIFNGKLVQIEAQFGKVELMFKDFCGFRLAYYEKRLALGIEIVLDNPNEYFAHRRKAIGGMAYFNVSKDTLPAIGLDCPIWLIGIKE